MLDDNDSSTDDAVPEQSPTDHHGYQGGQGGTGGVGGQGGTGGVGGQGGTGGVGGQGGFGGSGGPGDGSGEDTEYHSVANKSQHMLQLIRDRDEHLMDLVRLTASLNASVKAQASETARIDHTVREYITAQTQTRQSIEERFSHIDKKLARLHLWVVVLTIGMSEVVQSKVAKWLPSIFG